MLGVGIDWAEELHDVALGRPGEGVFDVVHVRDTAEAVHALIARLIDLEPDPAEVRVVIETRRGLLVEALADAGFTVLPVNPDLIAAFPAAVAIAGDDMTAPTFLELVERWPTPNALAGDDRGPAVPGGEIYLSLPGLGDLLAARIAAEIGDAISQFDSPNELQCYAGKAPVTRRSGKSELTVAHRLACNRCLADAVQQWAFCSLTRSGWARQLYDAKTAVGNSHHKALRALGNRWLEILWHCLTKGVCYDEAVHVANRNRAMGRTQEATQTAA